MPRVKENPVRVALVRPRPRLHMGFLPQKMMPLQLLSIGSMARSRGQIQLKLIDGFEGDGVEVAERTASEWQPHVVLLSASTANAYDAMVTAGVMRDACPETVIVAVGEHFSATTEETLRVCPAIDLVIPGEAEWAFGELCDALRAEEGVHSDWQAVLADVAGLAWLGGAGEPMSPSGGPQALRPMHHTAHRPLAEDLGELVSPAYDLTQPERYNMKPIPWRGFGLVEASRGCGHGCTFCTVPIHGGWRTRPVTAVFDDVRFLGSTTLGWSTIRFVDPSFGADPAWVVEFCQMILERCGSEFRFFADIRVDDLARLEPHFSLMAAAGFYGFCLGLESDDPSDLERWNKGHGPDAGKRLMPALRAHFEVIVGSFFVGDRDSSRQSFERMNTYADALDLDVFIQSPMRLFPPITPMAQDHLERGVEIPWDYDALGRCVPTQPTLTLKKRDVLRLRKRGVARFYSDPRRMLGALGRGQGARRMFFAMWISGLASQLDQLLPRLPDNGPMARRRNDYKKRHKVWTEA